MADDEDEDLYGDEFDFVDEDDLDEDTDNDDVAGDDVAEKEPFVETDADDEAGPNRDDISPAPAAANFVVHIYEYQKFNRTIDRPFTPEDAESFASEYNRTAKSYGRFAIAGKDDVKPKKTLE